MTTTTTKKKSSAERCTVFVLIKWHSHTIFLSYKIIINFQLTMIFLCKCGFCLVSDCDLWTLNLRPEHILLFYLKAKCISFLLYCFDACAWKFFGFIYYLSNYVFVFGLICSYLGYERQQFIKRLHGLELEIIAS